jgi:hypothetical protein
LIAAKKSSKAKVSLRMWSDSASLSDVAERINLKPAVVLEKGQPTVLPSGSASKHLSSRNYVSFEDSTLDSGPSLPSQIERLLDLVASSRLVPEIRAGTIEAAIWLAIFNNDESWTTFLPRKLRDRSSEIGVRLLVEDYSNLNADGIPKIQYL